MAKQLNSIAHHRNGICGEPFYVALFRDDDGSTKVAITFHNHPAECRTAVLNVEMLAAGNVTFGENSLRGDLYHDWMLDQIAQYTA